MRPRGHFKRGAACNRTDKVREDSALLALWAVYCCPTVKFILVITFSFSSIDNS